MNMKKNVKTPGIMKTSEAIRNSFSKPVYYKYLKDNEYEKVGPGIYASKDTIVDNLYVIHERCPKAAISHDEALYYYGLIDREPLQSTLTIYSGYNASKLKDAGYKVFFVKKDYLDLGKVEVKDNFGNIVPMYDLQRTICDLVRNRNSFEIQDFNTAMKSYVRRKDKDINKLMEYAKKLRVDKVVKQYMEILL